MRAAQRGASPYAPLGHTHETPQLPRWVRYLAVLVAALTLVVGADLYVNLRQESRVDGVEAFIGERTQIRDAERQEDLLRERLLICDLLLQLNGGDPTVQGLLARLQCPAAGSSAYGAVGVSPAE